jgi:hypothetical protein
MNETSRNQGRAIAAAAAAAALLFVIGILNGSYLALAIPVAIVTLFALGLVAWVGYTIATIQVEADASPEVLATDTADTSDTSEAADSEPTPGKPAAASSDAA